MCEPGEIPLPRTPPPSQAKPQTPDNIAIRYIPMFAQRVQRDTCFKCNKQGHWAMDCPLKSPDTVKMDWRCGHCFCEVRTTNAESNEWCDDPLSRKSDEPPSDNSMQPPTPPPRPGSCFRCKKQGHWAMDCPLKSPDTVKIDWRCGQGFCEVRTTNAESNKWFDDPLRKKSDEPPSDNSMTMQPPSPPPRPGSCFRCNKQGHWAMDCPLKSPDTVKIDWRCGQGFCEVRTTNAESSKWCDDPLSKKSDEPPSDNAMQQLTPPPRPGSCFRCNKPGHWVRDCPLKSAVSNRYPLIQCQCGHGFCEIKTCKGGINKGRQYYSCPIQRGKKCSFLWCDEATQERVEAPAPPFKYPECSSCFGGVCRREKETQGPNAGRYYFACPIKPGHGSCGFVMWEDEVQRDGQRTLEFMAGTSQVYETAGEDSWMGDALHLETFKRMKIMDGECAAAAMATPMEKGEHEGVVELATPTKSFSFPHLEIDDDLSDEVLCSVPLDEIIKNNSARKEFDHQSPHVPDSPFGILSNDGCSLPGMPNTCHVPPCSEIEMLEQPTGKNEATSSQEEFRELKLEIKGLKEKVAVLVSLMPSHLSDVPVNGVSSAAVQQAPLPPALQMHDSRLSGS